MKTQQHDEIDSLVELRKFTELLPLRAKLHNGDYRGQAALVAFFGRETVTQEEAEVLISLDEHDKVSMGIYGADQFTRYGILTKYSVQEHWMKCTRSSLIIEGLTDGGDEALIWIRPLNVQPQ